MTVLPLSMAFGRVFVLLLAIAVFASTVTSATKFIVGDDSGWTVGFDYQAWAKGKVFHVGDKLGKQLIKLVY